MPGPGKPAAVVVPVVTPAATTLAVAQEAVAEATVNNPTAQTVGGTLTQAANTPIGGTALMVGTNLGTSAIGSNIIGAPELPGLAWMVTFLVQIGKHIPRFNQQNVPLMTACLLVISIGICLLVWDGNLAKAISAAGVVAWQAQANYSQWKLTGFGGLTSAPTPNQSGG